MNRHCRCACIDCATPDVVVQVGVPPCRVDVLTSIDGVTFDDAWRDRVMVRVDGVDVTVISKRHRKVNNRATGRPQDIAGVTRLARGERHSG